MIMKSVLYLNGLQRKEFDVLLVSVESFISLFVYRYCDFTLEVCFVNTEETDYTCEIPLHTLSDLKYTNHDNLEIFNFLLPAIVSDAGKTIVAGLCSILRWAIKAHVSDFPNHYSQSLLGFRNGCLVACTESSIWTKFCELQLPSSVKEVSLKLKSGEFLTKIPENLILLEEHLKRPVRTHNILKRKLDIAKKVKQQQNSNFNSSSNVLELDAKFTLYNENLDPVDKNNVKEALENLTITEKSKDFCLDHSYLEGIDLTLADMIVFPCVHYLLTYLPFHAVNHLTNVANWYKQMCSNELIKKAAEKVGIVLEKKQKNLLIDEDIIVPDISQISLYKRDPSHTKLKCKHQNPEKIISLLLNAHISIKYDTTYCTKLDWDHLPPELHPTEGELPKKRREKKCQQLESIVTAVLKIAKENQTIVEFCAGGGHVGLLLAHFLPSCKVILIENKEFSMLRAKKRATKLNLENIIFYECNLDYFRGSFDIGVSLHACGVATDLVIQQCIQNQASFVCCPCCYGNIQDTHLLTYPLSQKYRSTILTKKDYMLLAHFADRNEINTPTADQGEICMGLIDTDRAFYAEEQNYKMTLTTLVPVTCSPKHNLLIGVSPVQLKE